MTNNLHGYRMTEFRKSCLRHNRMRKFLRPFLFGCGLTVLAAGFTLFQLHTAAAEQAHTELRGAGTPDNPYTVEPLDVSPSEAVVRPLKCSTGHRD